MLTTWNVDTMFLVLCEMPATCMLTLYTVSRSPGHTVAKIYLYIQSGTLQF